jgi:hypothetical protein
MTLNLLVPRALGVAAFVLLKVKDGRGELQSWLRTRRGQNQGIKIAHIPL